ncbi:hypothetical protein DSECCO2_641440 [anaerobic digester metagenome]
MLRKPLPFTEDHVVIVYILIGDNLFNRAVVTLLHLKNLFNHLKRLLYNITYIVEVRLAHR